VHPAPAPRALGGAVRADASPVELVRQISASVDEIRNDHRTQLDNMAEALSRLETRVDAVGANSRPMRTIGSTVSDQFTAVLRGAPQAAMEIGSGPDGGFTVPTEIDSTIQSLLRESTALRGMATVVTLGTGSGSWKKVIHRSGGGARWAHELEERSETSTPQLGAVEITPEEIYAIPEVTNHVLDDSSFNLSSFLEEDVAAEFTQGEGAAFVTGDGVKKPLGLLHKPTTAEADAERAFGTYQHLATGVDGDFAADGDGGFQANLIDLIYSLPASYRSGRGVGWLMNSLTASRVQKFRDADGRLMWRDGLDTREPSRLLGFPVAIEENMPDIASDALAIAFGNWKRGYAIVDHVGMKLIRDQVTKKGWTKFYFSKRTGGAPLDTNAIKFLKFSAA
jgi:HK97 family phage major capsid protein